LKPEGMKDDRLLMLAAAAEQSSLHPISRCICESYCGTIDTDDLHDVQEIAGQGVTAVYRGERISVGNQKLMEELGLSVKEPDHSGTIVHVAVNDTYAGCIIIEDEPKPSAAEAVSALKQAGISRTVMLTGDQHAPAQQVAQRLGIDEYHARLLPQQKVEILERLLEVRQKDETIAFVGDGINDAPVLTRADVGIAMGALGSDAAIEAADIVLMDDDPRKLALAIRISRRTLGIARQNIVFALGVKLAVLLLVAVGSAGMWLAVFADVGVSVIAVLNAMRTLKAK